MRDVVVVKTALNKQIANSKYLVEQNKKKPQPHRAKKNIVCTKKQKKTKKRLEARK